MKFDLSSLSNSTSILLLQTVNNKSYLIKMETCYSTCMAM